MNAPDHKAVTMPLAYAIKVFDKSAARTKPNDQTEAWEVIRAELEKLRQRCGALEADAERLDYVERTFSGMTNRERYLPVQMIWGKGCNGRTLREACDKYMKRDTAIDRAGGGES